MHNNILKKLDHERKEVIEARKRENKNKEEHIDDEDHTQPWKVVAKYTDLTKKDEGEKEEKDTSRMRKILLELKNEKSK